jgi:hypothetical protein
VTINNQQARANYIVLLDHEGGKSYLQHRNKVAVFDAQSGDSLISKSTLSVGGAVDDACKGIMQHWDAHKPTPGHAQQSQLTSAPSGTVTPVASGGTLTAVNLSSTPAGADVEVDGKFVGDTPSSTMLPAGEHSIRITKKGYKAWERKLTVSGGSSNINAELEEEK